MSTVGDAGRDRGDVMRLIRELQREVQQLRAAHTLRAATIGGGGLRVKDGGSIEIIDADGNVALDLASEGMTLEGLLEVLGRFVFRDEDGQPRVLISGSASGTDANLTYRSSRGEAEVAIGTIFFNDGRRAHGLLVQFPDGRNMIRAWSGESSQVGFGHWNSDWLGIATTSSTEQGDEAYVADNVGERYIRVVNSRGLVRPFIPVMWTSGWNGNHTVDSSSWTEVGEARCRKSNPNLWALARVAITGSGTFEVRIRDITGGGNTTIMSWTGVSSNTYLSDAGTLPGTPYDFRVLVLEARRVSGSGSARVDCAYSEIGGN